MKKQTHSKWTSGVLLLILIAVISETGFSGVGDGKGGRSRWEGRFKKDSPQTTSTPATDKETGSGKADYGDGKSDCKESFLMMNAQYDNPVESGKSRLKIQKMHHGDSLPYSCMNTEPKLKNKDQFEVTKGNIIVKCENGNVFVTTSDCWAISRAEWEEQERIRIAAEKAEAERLAEIERQRQAELERQRLAELERQRIAAEKAAAEKAAAEAAAAAHAAANPQCYGCSASATCVVKSERQNSKNSFTYYTTYYYACSNGNSKVTYSSGSQGCVTGQKICSSSSSSK